MSAKCQTKAKLQCQVKNIRIIYKLLWTEAKKLIFLKKYHRKANDYKGLIHQSIPHILRRTSIGSIHRIQVEFPSFSEDSCVYPVTVWGWTRPPPGSPATEASPPWRSALGGHKRPPKIRNMTSWKKSSKVKKMYVSLFPYCNYIFFIYFPDLKGGDWFWRLPG